MYVRTHRSCDAVLSKYLFFTLCWLYSPSYFLDLLPVCKYVYFNKFWKRKNLYEEKEQSSDRMHGSVIFCSFRKLWLSAQPTDGHEGSLEKIHFQYYIPVRNSHKSPQHSNAKIQHNYIANQRKMRKRIITLSSWHIGVSQQTNPQIPSSIL